MTRAWLTVKDVCEELSIHRATWYRWVADPEMSTPEPISGIGRLKRYSRESFQQFLKTHGGINGGTDLPSDNNPKQNQNAI
ncbi:MAG: helix-turn-helix domain-containing protein [Pseudomonadota bacterium]